MMFGDDCSGCSSGSCHSCGPSDDSKCDVCGAEPCACAAADMDEQEGEGECAACGSTGEIGSECCGTERMAPPAPGSGDKEEVPPAEEEENGNKAA